MHIQQIKEIIIYLVFTILFFLGGLYYKNYDNRQKEKENLYHSNALSDYAWNLDYDGMKHYLAYAVNFSDYSQAVYFDLVTGKTELKISGKSLNGFDLFLMKLKLLNTVGITQKVTKDNEILGELRITYIDKKFYGYSYIFLIFILLQLIANLMIRLYRSRHNLEVRVKRRTQELEREIKNRLEIEEDLRLTLDSIGDGVMTINLENRISRMNPVAEKLTGWSNNDAVGMLFYDVYITQPKYQLLEEIVRNGNPTRSKQAKRLISKNGEEHQISESGATIKSSDGGVSGIVLVIRDVTKEYKLQTELEHSQRLDAVGKLAGGIAHDFNNLLAGILGFAEIIEDYLTDQPEALKMNHMLIETCERASELTNQLLTFSRKKNIKSEAINLNELAEKTVSLLKRTLDRKIRIVFDPGADKAVISGDFSMLQNAIINLGINASHAMPEGGQLLIKTSNLVLDSSYCDSSAFDLIPGDYIELRIEDDGSGIPREILPRIFEPFFTTKAQGKGTGMGLAAVYGTITQHNGEIKVYSEESFGTSFHIQLPLSGVGIKSKVAGEMSGIRGLGTILLADDETIIRVTATKILESIGYKVIVAENGKEACELFKKKKEAIDLVILDMIMPEMGGKDSFFIIKELSPKTPIVLASGFSETDDVKYLKERGLDAFIAKPYRRNQLNSLIQQLIPPASS